MYDDAVVRHVEGDVGHVQGIVGEILLDHVAPVAAADHEFVYAVRGIDFHDVPENRPAADFNHGLRLKVGFLGNPSSETAGEDDCLHKATNCIQVNAKTRPEILT